MFITADANYLHERRGSIKDLPSKYFNVPRVHLNQGSNLRISFPCVISCPSHVLYLQYINLVSLSFDKTAIGRRVARKFCLRL